MKSIDKIEQSYFETDFLPFLEPIVDQDKPTDNRRTAVRYLRDDIILILKQCSLLTEQILPPVKILNISAKGAYICSSVKLNIKKRIVLIFAFKDGKQFKTEATIISNRPNNTFCYGLKFKKFNHALGDHLVESQQCLLFQ